jgi:hypothetical protein
MKQYAELESKAYNMYADPDIPGSSSPPSTTQTTTKTVMTTRETKTSTSAKTSIPSSTRKTNFESILQSSTTSSKQLEKLTSPKTIKAEMSFSMDEIKGYLDEAIYKSRLVVNL